MLWQSSQRVSHTQTPLPEPEDSYKIFLCTIIPLISDNFKDISSNHLFRLSAFWVQCSSFSSSVLSSLKICLVHHMTLHWCLPTFIFLAEVISTKNTELGKLEWVLKVHVTTQNQRLRILSFVILVKASNKLCHVCMQNSNKLRIKTKCIFK